MSQSIIDQGRDCQRRPADLELGFRGKPDRKGRGVMTYSAVLFDMDGVLVDSEPIINAAAIRALAEFGIRAQPEDFLAFVGAGEDRYVGGVAELHGKTYIPEMKRRTYEWYLALLPEMGRAFPGAKELIELLGRRGVLCAVASSADRIKVEANLTRVLGVGLDSFAGLVTGEDVARRKPHPDIFLEAARRLAVPAEACCVVEDAVNGVQAAKAAGMRCVAVTTSFAEESLRTAGADVVRPSLAEVTVDDLVGEASGQRMPPILGQEKKDSRPIAVSPLEQRECGKQDLNLHPLTGTRPST